MQAYRDQYARLFRDGQGVILVGISYGGLGFANGNMRSTDYTAPADEPEYWGGAETYQRFLADELLPRIDKNYRADPERRILLGQSLGGQFVLFSALTRPGLFFGRIAVNPALHRNLDYFLDLRVPDGTSPPRLFIAASSQERTGLREPLKQWLAARRDDPRLKLHVETLPGQHHASAAPAAYRTGMRWLFGTNDQDVVGDD